MNESVSAQSPSQGRPRPALFRALGKSEPPGEITIDGQPYLLKQIYKHDSWAATALYEGHGRLITAKFNRQQRIGFIPMGWLGRWLARHEAALLHRLSDLPNMPRLLGHVMINGKRVRHAIARSYIAGHPMRSNEPLPVAFFNELQQAISEVHRRNIAYMDLHKRENVIVGDDGRPYLIDFQVSYILPRGWWTRLTLLPWILKLAQQSDDYHVVKHIIRHSQLDPDEARARIAAARPLWIKIHRWFAVPFRAFRRRLLVCFGIRKGKGRVESEAFAEDALRQAA